ncbi:ferritin-like domain-containing protein [Tricladium varicosporioides]|nr:ferritin-like domain-containing protein [Hymenoscyphus varicosporioides]
MRAIFYSSSILVGSLVAAAPLCTNITDLAGGSLPYIDKPSSISASAVKDFQLALFLENLEVSFFQAGLTNITGWNIGGYPHDTIEVVSKVAAQEEVHVATILDLLEHYDAPRIPPCNYSFPVNSTPGFFELADIITSIGIGSTIGLAERLAITDPLLIQSVSSILTVESRHNAFFRHIEGKSPNPAPFDTGISDIWAYNLALSFIVPGSCAVEMSLPILSTLSVSKLIYHSTEPPLREFEWDPTQMAFVAEAGKQLLVGWVNQLNKPVYTPLNITVKGKGTTVPDNTDDLALATLAGPVLLTLS